jgi:hypothetical protein
MNRQIGNGICIFKWYFDIVVILSQKIKVYNKMGVLHFPLPQKNMICRKIK